MKKLIIIALIGVLLVAVPLTTAKLDWDDILLILTSGMVQNARFQNLTVTGNITAENVWIPTLIFTHTNSTIPVAVGGTWYNVTFDQEDDVIKRRITHTYNDATNTTFIIQDAGTYQIDYTMVFQDTAPAPNGHITSRVVRNSIEIAGSAIEIDTTKQNADTLISQCSANDEIKFQFTADDDTISLASHLTYGDHQDTAVISIKRVA